MSAGKLFWACTAGVAYVYAGYPAALWLLTRNRHPGPQPPAPTTPRASLIIAAFNEQKAIAAKLENSLALDHPELEIIVVTDGSDDETPTVASAYADRGVRVLHDPARAGKSAALNRGAAAATGDVLVFSDANNHFGADAISHLAAAFADPMVGGATGQKTVLTDSALGQSEGLYWRYEAAIRSMESRLGSCTAANGEILAVRASEFRPIPPDVINDDLYLAMTILGSGRRFVYVPEAVSREKPADSLTSERERRSRMSAGRFSLLARPGFAFGGGPLVTWQFLSHKVGRLAVPFMMFGALFAAIAALRGPRRGILELGGTWAKVATAGQLGFHLASWAGMNDDLISGEGRLAKLCRAAGYIQAGNLSTMSGFWRFIRGRQTVQWERVGRQD
jgi:poly-beta-1,6-N-acetyl-D-glucosamine synthase